jgi:hypothetical protein
VVLVVVTTFLRCSSWVPERSSVQDLVRFLVTSVLVSLNWTGMTPRLAGQDEVPSELMGCWIWDLYSGKTCCSSADCWRVSETGTVLDWICSDSMEVSVISVDDVIDQPPPIDTDRDWTDVDTTGIAGSGVADAAPAVISMRRAATTPTSAVRIRDMPFCWLGPALGSDVHGRAVDAQGRRCRAGAGTRPRPLQVWPNQVGWGTGAVAAHHWRPAERPGRPMACRRSASLARQTALRLKAQRSAGGVAG